MINEAACGEDGAVNTDQQDVHQVIRQPEFNALILERIEQRLSQFPGHARIRKALLLLEPFTLENELLTVTMKMRRNKISAKYMSEIDRLFQEELSDR